MAPLRFSCLPHFPIDADVQASSNALQVGVFSATLPPEALEITKKFMHKPVRILVKRDELTLEGIKQVRSDASDLVAVKSNVF